MLTIESSWEYFKQDIKQSKTVKDSFDILLSYFRYEVHEWAGTRKQKFNEWICRNTHHKYEYKTSYQGIYWMCTRCFDEEWEFRMDYL